MEELGGKDIQDIVKEMEDTDFRSSLESKLPAYNTRVKLPTVNERMAGFEGIKSRSDHVLNMENQKFSA